MSSAKQRVILVTGANKGIGFEVIKKLLEESSASSNNLILLGSRDLKRGQDALLQLVTVNIRDRLKASNMKFDRYKFIVQCIIGENKGQGVKYSCRCLWDADTDGMAK
ncbi:unnamed protein product [Adineta steineri]|uniref:Uncharacterized protein n=1 Tax=Adineta steineri TaxID=433720 RepID=A0A813VPG9_9BILA|nr:unnamed protein product [Adineta steineri]